MPSMLHTPPPDVSKQRDDSLQQQAAKDEGLSATDPTMRRSERTNKGVGPSRYDQLLQNQIYEKSDANFRGPPSVALGALSSRSSKTPSVRSRNSASSSVITSKQLEIELRRQEELAEIDRQQADRDRQLVELRARLKEAKLFENSDINRLSKASKSITSSSHAKVINWLGSETGKSNGTELRDYRKRQSRNDVSEFERDYGDRQFDNEGRPSELNYRNRQSEFESRPLENRYYREFKPIDNRGLLNVNAPYTQSKYMARQAIGKELPNFKGSTTDWILFEKIFYQTTEACGFSPAEKMIRLQKCLQGEALEAVRALLMTSNVDKVMAVLKRRFGRSEYIIEELMNKVLNCANVKEDRPITIIKFSEMVTNLVATIESLNQFHYLTNPILVRKLVNKLPASARMNWGKYSSTQNNVYGLQLFATWLENEAEAASVIFVPQSSEKDSNDKRVLSFREKETSDECGYCRKKSHKTEKCYSYLKLSVDDRWEWVKEKKVCFGCLSSEHGIKECKRGKCGQNNCKYKHHPTLHNDYLKKLHEKRDQEKAADAKAPDKKETDDKVADPEQVNCTRKRDKRVYLQIIPVTLKGPGGKIDTYAILDGGSTVSLISEEIANSLQLKGPIKPLIASWYDDTTKEDKESRRVSLEIRGTAGKTYSMHDVRTTKMRMPGQSMTITADKWPHLKELDIPDLDNAVPTIMIGEDNLHLKKILKQITGKVGKPFASLTPLGWMVHGPDDLQRADKEYTLFLNRKQDEIELNDRLRDFWTTESFGVTPSQKTLISTEELRAREILDKTMKRVGNQWEVGLLWKSDHEELPESWKSAEKRLLSIEKKGSRDVEFGRKYEENIQAYIKKGYARRLTDKEARTTNKRTWYLPHFAVNNPQKPTKLRMVFDAAAKSHGSCLNDKLLKGPDLLNSLPGVLFKFRERKVAIVGDLREMFHQVRIRDEDCSSQRFLWRDADSNKIHTMEMTVMIFGAISSPYVAQEVKNRNAEEHKEMYPEACAAIIDQHYMDDYLDSQDTPEATLKRVIDVSFVHQQGGFELRNIMTNSTEVRRALNPEVLAPAGSSLTLTEENYTRVLGVNWTPEVDSFLFKADFPRLDKNILTGDKTPTKRDVLKLLMSVFDPLGLLAVLTIKGKILMQDIWKQGTDWDEKISEEHAERWKTWLNDLHYIQSLRIPRCYSTDIGKTSNIQLHIFCDASIQAFAAVAYLRFEGENDTQVSLVMAKTRVAPIKLLTVPRLELQSAVMASRLAAFVKQEHKLEITRTVYWSDSQTTLSWIKSDARKYQPFVAHRIAEILDSTSPAEWKWVPTRENVADEATRNQHQERLTKESRWFKGPDFLQQTEDNWPQQVTISNEIEKTEMKKEFCLLTSLEPELLDNEKFSSWHTMTRVIAWVLRFVDKCKKRNQTNGTSELNGQEIRRAENFLLKQSQRESFSEDLRRLRNDKGVSSTSKILTLSPIIEDDLIKMDGRVVQHDKTGLKPIILDGKNKIVKLLIRSYHRRAGHHGRERVVNDLREKFWIINIRAAVRSAWNDCLDCKHRRVTPRVPRMAPLPIARTQNHIPAFTDTGIDYFGPMYVTIGRRREKRYGVLFTCLTVRAVHLEIAASLTTDSMIMALRRMMSRRGVPKRIFCDNGTNLRGASEELRKALQGFDENEILRQTSVNKIIWHFNPPGGPHMGGCWERLIGSVKRALKTTLNEQAPKEEVLQTLLAEAEYSVNSRPLTHVSDDPTDDRSLTPNDFLRMSPNGILTTHGTPGEFTEADSLRRQWRFAQNLANQFWKRWIKEYLPSINRRTKWHREQQDLKVDDLVIIWDENAPRNEWKRGRVTAVHPGRDGRVRVADVRTTTGTYRRPVSKLCVLEMQ